MVSYEPMASNVPSGFQSSDVRSPCVSLDTFSRAVGSAGPTANSDAFAEGGGFGRSQTLTTPSFELFRFAKVINHVFTHIAKKPYPEARRLGSLGLKEQTKT